MASMAIVINFNHLFIQDLGNKHLVLTVSLKILANEMPNALSELDFDDFSLTIGSG